MMAVCALPLWIDRTSKKKKTKKKKNLHKSKLIKVGNGVVER